MSFVQLFLCGRGKMDTQTEHEELPNSSSKISGTCNLLITLLPTVDLYSVLGMLWSTASVALYLGITHAFLDVWTGTVFDVIAISV